MGLSSTGSTFPSAGGFSCSQGAGVSAVDMAAASDASRARKRAIISVLLPAPRTSFKKQPPALATPVMQGWRPS